MRVDYFWGERASKMAAVYLRGFRIVPIICSYCTTKGGKSTNTKK